MKALPQYRVIPNLSRPHGEPPTLAQQRYLSGLWRDPTREKDRIQLAAVVLDWTHDKVHYYAGKLRLLER